MLKIKNPKKKVLGFLGALLMIVLLLPLFAAFEAHVINVKAHIENALQVSPAEIDFGTVFPEEGLDATFTVALSNSFMDTTQTRVKDVEYRIVQRRKPRVEGDKLDVVFAFDLTNSMGGVLAQAQANAVAIMTYLQTVSPDVQFGVMSHADYPNSYTSFGYSANYGSSSDYAYKLEQPLTPDTAAVNTVISGLTIFSGGDGPEDYTRIMYESYNDSAVSWRSGAIKIVIMINDNVPHDNDLNAGVPGKTGTWSTGGDPGPNGIMDLGPDDLDLQTELSNMASMGRKLFVLHSGGYLDYWQHWAGITGGNAVKLSDYSNITEAIEELIRYKDLRPFLIKTKVETDAVIDTEATATLDKQIGDIVDTWNVHLDVPLIAGSTPIPPDAPVVPEDPPGSGTAGDYGADIWIEVTGLSYAGSSTGYDHGGLACTVCHPGGGPNTTTCLDCHSVGGVGTF